MDVQFEHTEQGLFLVSARDFQIINGGQTTASLSSARYNYKDKANLGAIFVQMKLTVINRTLEDDAAAALVQNISRSSNSQNKVSDSDFFSTHPFHVQMERCSQRLGARGTGGLQFETKWFYERARGQYLQKQMRMTASEKKKFLLQNPKKQLITKTDLAKVRNTWDGHPHLVSKGVQTNFTEFAQKIDVYKRQVWGSWFRMMRQAELSKLARVQVDIPNELDSLWTLDIKKSTAMPPEEVRNNLDSIIERLAEHSKRTWVFRGKKETHDSIVHVWQRFKGKQGGAIYTINRDHPLVEVFENSSPQVKRNLENLLKAIEEGLPPVSYTHLKAMT